MKESIRKKGKNIDVLIDTTSPDIIIGTETWLSDDVRTEEFFNPALGYKVYRNDRKSDAHGGVMIAIRSELELIDVRSSSRVELISGVVKLTKNKKLVLAAFYRPPDMVDEKDLEAVYTEFTDLRKQYRNSMYILAGDFNIPDIDWNALTVKNNNQYPLRVSQTFLDIAQDMSLEQIVDFPTRGDNLLDLVFTSHPSHKIRCKPLPPVGPKSDHDIVLLDTSLQAVRTKPVKRKIYLWKKADTDGIKANLSNYSTEFRARDFSSVGDMWQDFKATIMATMENFVPSKMSSSRHTHPWINTKIRRATRRKQRAYKKAKSTHQKKDWDRYKNIQASAQKEIRYAHRQYMEDVVSSDMKQNPKQFWSFIKSKRQDSTGVSSLIDKDGFLHSDGSRKAEILNEQFHAAYTREDTSVLPDKGKSPYPAMARIKVYKDGVLKLLKNLKPHKASGPDGIPTRILILAAEQLAPVLTEIFQSSLDLGQLPTEWKDALISPIYKKGDRTSATNYRPVSLTCVICKLLEHIIHSSVMKHLDKYDIITDKQHGFRRRRSCETQLIATIEGIASKLRSGKDQVDIILLDFAKAFDKVPHVRLLHKLQYYGIRGETLTWIKEFLSGRSQQVILEGQNSRKDVLSGVPQGTVLGPLLFLAFINDLPEVVKTSEARLFADDCLLYRQIKNDKDTADLQADLSALEDWETKWQMRFHPEKCTVIRVCTNKRWRKQTSYKLHDHVLDVVDCNKYLGVNISEDLSWKKQVDYTAAKASRTLGFLRRNLRECSKNVRSSAYSAMVQPTLDYASTTWDPYAKEDINTLDKVQRRGARFVCNNYTDRTLGCVTAMINSLGWIPLSTRRCHQRLIMLYKIQHSQVDIGQFNILRPNDHRTRGAYRLYQIPAAQNVYKYSFFPRTIHDWNRLPTFVTDCVSLEDFKAAMTTAALTSPVAY